MDPEPQIEVQNDRSGCAGWVLYLVAVVWILLTTIGALFFSWLVDELQFEGGPAETHWIHIALIAGYGLAIALPMFLLRLVWKTPIPRAVFLTWGLAGVFAGLVSLKGIAGLTDAQAANLLQIAGSVIYLAGITLWNRRRGRRLNGVPRPREGRWPVVLCLVGLLALPWVAWGALGSPLDLVLNLIAALLFGAAAALTIRQIWDPQVTSSGALTTRALIGAGGAAALVLLIMATGFGTGGLQVALPLLLAPLGWLAAALFAGMPYSAGWKGLALLLGLTAALPLLFLDPDELALVIARGQGELIGWSIQMVIDSLAIGLLAVLAAYLLRSNPGWLIGRLPWAAAGLVWLAVLGVYLFAGQPGFHGERLFVIMKDQADVSAAVSMEPIDDRRVFVYTTLTDRAQSTQSELRASLDRFGIDYTSYYLVNALEINGGPLLRLWLETRPEVDRVLDSPVLRPLPEPVPVSQGGEPAPSVTPWNITRIGADRVWQEFDVRGAGVVIGQSDSGVQGDHPELTDSYRGLAGGNDRNWYDPWNHTQAPGDIGGHGTHTLGSIVGNSVGIAPDATWIGCVNLARNLGNPAYYLSCLQFMLAPFPQDGDPMVDGDPTQAADVLNNSWGCPPIEGCDPRVLQPAVDALRAAGIFVVASAGNEGAFGCGSVSDPIAIYDSAYSVGAIDPTGSLAMFSSLGPVSVDGSGRIKPDIVAPGVDILSAFPGGTYSTLGGTSMAGPHVAGVVALIWSANPDLIGNIERTEDILSRSAAGYTGTLPICVNSVEVPNNAFGWGVVDAYAAVQLALDE